MKWVTPERLLRERESSARTNIERFIKEENLGILVLGEGPAFTTLFGVGVGPSRRPYTYPQVLELMELAAIMESALERAHFAAKVQRAEQLATLGLVGASLAHEIRNPLVSIKTFVQLLPTHHGDPVFREKFFRLIGGEVQRIDELTQQLLDLAAPRTYQAEALGLHAALRSGLELLQAKAAERSVRVETSWQADPDDVFTDAGVAKQVLLNLGFNAIQAAEEKGGADRWLRISTRRLAVGVEMAVSDSGAGIDPGFQRRLFQPFQTTRSRGFGLGLAICRDILANVHATITADQPVPGQGATFRVVFPCQSPSS
jgi:signal transduction histidine kinase